jgi:hypothetical protein
MMSKVAEEAVNLFGEDWKTNMTKILDKPYSEKLSDPGAILVQSIQKVIHEACCDLDKVSHYEDATHLAREISEAISKYRVYAAKNLPSNMGGE